MTTPYKVIHLTADGAVGYRTEEPKYLAKDIEYSHALTKFDCDHSEWLSSGEELEFAEGEEDKINEHFILYNILKRRFVSANLNLSLLENYDITDFVEVKHDTVPVRIWNGVKFGGGQNVNSPLRLYFRSPIAEEETQEIMLESIHSMLSNDMQFNYSDILKQFKITRL